MSFPDSRVGVFVRRLQMVLFNTLHLGTPRVVDPIDFNHRCARWRIDYETPEGLVSVELRVEANPDLGPLLADGRAEEIPRLLRRSLSLIKPWE